MRSTAYTLTPSTPPDAIIHAGAYNLPSLGPEGAKLYIVLQEVYMRALHKTFIFPIVATGVALLATFGFENKNIETIGKKREAQRSQGVNLMDMASPD
jgi:hypothetical protein